MSTEEWCAAVGTALVAGRRPPAVEGGVALAVRHFLRLQGLSGLAGRTMEEGGERFVPEPIASAIREDWTNAQAWSQRLDLECRRIGGAALDALRASGLSAPILLKGPVVARRYRDPSLRPYVDIDLLVPPDEVRRWAEVIVKLGYWAPPPEIAATARRHQEGVSFERPAGPNNVSIDLHGCLFIERRARELTHAALTPFTTPSAFSGLYELTPEALLVALALHLVHHSRGAWRLIWLRDFIEVATPQAVEAGRALAADYEVSWALERALHASEEVLGHPMWGADVVPSGRGVGLARVHELERTQYLRHVALVRELGLLAGARHLASRISPRRFAMPGGGIDWSAARAWIRLATLRARGTPWSRGLSVSNAKLGAASALLSQASDGGRAARLGASRPRGADSAAQAAASVALVFVATDERPFLVAALESLFHSPPTRPFQVVVVDNASRDGVGSEVARRWPQVQVVTQGERRSLYANLNAGISATTGAYVMVCNSDVAFRARAVDRLAGFLDANPAAGMAAPTLLSPEGEISPSARRWYTLRSLVALKSPAIRNPSRFACVRDSLYGDWDRSSPRSVNWVHCPATIVRRTALDDVGHWDDRFRVYFGDVDLCLRMHDAGWQVWCVPEAEVVHHWQRASTQPLSRAWFSHLDSLLRFACKHKGLHPQGHRFVPGRGQKGEQSSRGTALSATEPAPRPL